MSSLSAFFSRLSLFKQRDPVETELRNAIDKLKSYESSLSKELKRLESFPSLRSVEVGRTRDECVKKLLLVYSWGLTDVLDVFYTQSVLLMKRAYLRSLTDALALRALQDALQGSVAWRRTLEAALMRRVEAGEAGEGAKRGGGTKVTVQVGQPTSTVAGTGLMHDLNEFHQSPAEVVRNASGVRKLTKRVAKLTQALLELDATVAGFKSTLRPLNKGEKRAALEALIVAESEGETREQTSTSACEDALAGLESDLSCVPPFHAEAGGEMLELKLETGRRHSRYSADEVDSDGGSDVTQSRDCDVGRFKLHPCARFIPLLVMKRAQFQCILTPVEVDGGANPFPTTHGLEPPRAPGRTASQGEVEPGVEKRAATRAGLVHSTSTAAAASAGKAVTHADAYAAMDEAPIVVSSPPLLPAPSAGEDVRADVVDAAPPAVAAPQPPVARDHGDSVAFMLFTHAMLLPPSCAAAAAAKALHEWQAHLTSHACSQRGSDVGRVREASDACGEVGESTGAGGEWSLPPAVSARMQQLRGNLTARIMVQRQRDASMRSFNRILCDQRSREGRLLQRWCQRVLLTPWGDTYEYAYDMSRLLCTFDPGQAFIDRVRSQINFAATGSPLPPTGAASAFEAARQESTSLSAAVVAGAPAAVTRPRMGVDTAAAGDVITSPPASTSSYSDLRSPVAAVEASSSMLDGITSPPVAVPDARAHARDVDLLTRTAATGSSTPASSTLTSMFAPATRRLSTHADSPATSVASTISPRKGAGHTRYGGGRTSMGGAAAAAPASGSKPAPTRSGGGAPSQSHVPTPHTIAAFVKHCSLEVFNEYSLHSALRSGAPESEASPGADRAAADALEAKRLLRVYVSRCVYARVHALLFSGLDVVSQPVAAVAPPPMTLTPPPSHTRCGHSETPLQTPLRVGGDGGTRLSLLALPPSVHSSMPSHTPTQEAVQDLLLHANSAAYSISPTRGIMFHKEREGSVVQASAAPPPAPPVSPTVPGEVNASATALPFRPPGCAADVLVRRDRIWSKRSRACAATPASFAGIHEGFFHALPTDVCTIACQLPSGAAAADTASGGVDGASHASVNVTWKYAPYSIASSLLACLDVCMSGDDMRTYMCACMDALAAEAGARAAAYAAAVRKDAPVLGADDIMPLTIYVAVHSGWNRPHACLSYLSNYGMGSGSGTGREGYILTLIQSAIAHVCTRAGAAHTSPESATAAVGRSTPRVRAFSDDASLGRPDTSSTPVSHMSPPSSRAADVAAERGEVLLEMRSLTRARQDEDTGGDDVAQFGRAYEAGGLDDTGDDVDAYTAFAAGLGAQPAAPGASGAAGHTRVMDIDAGMHALTAHATGSAEAVVAAARVRRHTPAAVVLQPEEDLSVDDEDYETLLQEDATGSEGGSIRTDGDADSQQLSLVRSLIDEQDRIEGALRMFV